MYWPKYFNGPNEWIIKQFGTGHIYRIFNNLVFAQFFTAFKDSYLRYQSNLPK